MYRYTLIPNLLSASPEKSTFLDERRRQLLADKAPPPPS
jgi:hypothetical protein